MAAVPTGDREVLGTTATVIMRNCQGAFTSKTRAVFRNKALLTTGPDPIKIYFSIKFHPTLLFTNQINT